MDDIEDKIIEILSDGNIMQFSEKEYLRSWKMRERGKPYCEPDIAPCTCDAFWFCEHRIRYFAQKIAAFVREREHA